MTPEEQATADAAAKIAADAAVKTNDGNRLADLESKLEAERKGRQELELRLAKEKVFSTFTNIKDFEDMIIGKTPDEIFNSAKILSEKITARDTAALKVKEDELKAKWGEIPGGTPINPALTQTRMDEYEAAKKIPELSKRVAAMFRMKVEDLNTRARSALQALARS